MGDYWLTADLGINGRFVPYARAPVCVDTESVLKCQPLPNDKDAGWGIQLALGGVYTSDDELKGGKLDAHMTYSGSRSFQLLGGGISAAYRLAIARRAVFLAKLSYEILYMWNTDTGSEQLVHGFGLGPEVEARINKWVSIYAGGGVLVAPTLNELSAYMVDAGVRGSFWASDVESSMPSQKPPVDDPKTKAEEERLRALAALDRAKQTLALAQRHLDPAWFTKYVDEQYKKRPNKDIHPLQIELKAIEECVGWATGKDQFWRAADVRSFDDLHKTIMASTDLVHASNAVGAEERQLAATTDEEMEKIPTHTASAMMERLVDAKQDGLLQRLVTWGRKIKADIAKLPPRAGGMDEALQVMEYESALSAYLAVATVLSPILPTSDERKTLGSASKLIGCLKGDGRCTEIDAEGVFGTGATFDGSITIAALRKQMEDKKTEMLPP